MSGRAFLFAWVAVAALLGGLSLSNHAAVGFAAEVRIADSKGDWGYPNPYRHYPRGPGYVRMSWVFDTLLWKDRKGTIPALARSWSFDPDRLSFSFKLNPKARWHDGQPLTSSDVVFTLEYYKRHPYSWITVDPVSHAVAEDPHTVVVYLARPYSPFLSEIGESMPVLPRHIWERVENPETFDGPGACIGSGPYLFRDFNKAQGTYLYELFPGYYQGRPKADRLIYTHSGKPLVSLSNGEADLAQIRPEMASSLEKKGLTVIRDEGGWVKKLMINHRKPPFDDHRFRRALAYAIDRQEVIDRSQRGFARPASYGLLSLDHGMFNPKTPSYPPSREKARALIESLGYHRGGDGFYRRGDKPLKVELLASNITVGGQSAADRDGEVIRRQLETVGIQVDLLALEQTTADSKVKNWDFDLALSGHGGITADPRNLNEMISSRYGAGSVNSARYDADPVLGRLMEAQIAEMDEGKRREIVFKIQDLHAGQLPAICLYYPDTLSAYNPGKGITWYYTRGGISRGIPIPQNKMSLIGK